MNDLAVVGQVIGWALSTAIAVLFLQSVLREESRSFRALVYAIAPGLGFGISSLIWFAVWCRGGSGSILVPLSAEFALLLLLLRYQPARLATSKERMDGWFWVSVCVVSGLALFYFVRFLAAGPYGGWDAWAIWNLHARALFLGGGRFWKTELYKLGWSHPDYPLLLPLTIARLWFFAGREVLAAPAAVAAYFTFGTAAVLTITLQRTKGQWAAVLGLATLLASHDFLWIGVQQYADVPLGFYIAVVFCCFSLAEHAGQAQLLVVAGFAAGLAAWTKNEGTMFLTCLLVSLAIIQLLNKSLRWPLWGWLRFAVGAALPVFATVAYKRRLPTQGDVASWLFTHGAWSRAFNRERVLFIAGKFAETLWRLDTWFVSSVLVLVVFVLLAGVDRNGCRRSTLRVSVLTAVFLIIAYGAVYATSPMGVDGLQEYLRSSLDRLYVQLWPMAVLDVFLVARFSSP